MTFLISMVVKTKLCSANEPKYVVKLYKGLSVTSRHFEIVKDVLQILTHTIMMAFFLAGRKGKSGPFCSLFLLP